MTDRARWTTLNASSMGAPESMVTTILSFTSLTFVVTGT